MSAADASGPAADRGLWSMLGDQLMHPRGVMGALVGRLMRFANNRPNRMAIASLDIQPSDVVLELGFGPGHAMQIMAGLVPEGRVYGVDQSHAMLRQACARNRDAVRACRVVLTCGDFARLPQPTASIDKVLAVNVAYFWKDDQAVLAEVRRVLRPGGRLAIYVTEPGVLKRWRVAAPDSHRLIDRADLQAMLSSAGFAPADIRIEHRHVAAGVGAFLAVAIRR